MQWLASQVQALVAAVDSLFQWLVGTADGRSTYAVTRWVFLRALGLIYLIAFVSFWAQVRGLIGSQGILSAQQYLHAAKAYIGPEPYRVGRPCSGDRRETHRPAARVRARRRPRGAARVQRGTGPEPRAPAGAASLPRHGRTRGMIRSSASRLMSSPGIPSA